MMIITTQAQTVAPDNPYAAWMSAASIGLQPRLTRLRKH